MTKFHDIPKNEWMFYTILIAVLGCCLGMLLSLLFAAIETTSEVINVGIGFSNLYIVVLLSIGSGSFLGAIFVLFKWFSLKNCAKRLTSV